MRPLSARHRQGLAGRLMIGGRRMIGGRLMIGMVLTLALTVVSLVAGQGGAAAATTTEFPAAALESESSEPTSGLDVTAGVSDSIVRLYLAVFDRNPDADGQDYWVGQYVDGVELGRIAEAFMSSEEWQRHIGTLTDAEFVALLYNNVLNRAPDAHGERYWLTQAAAGLSRTDMLLWFSEGDEFVRLTGTATPEPPPAPAFPALPTDSGTGRRIVYANSDQRAWIVEDDGAVRDSYPVSGRAGVPNPGVYQVYSKSELAYAGHDGITMEHMVRFAWGARLSIGFHAIPRYAGGTPMQTEDQLGTYQSAGCVRQADHQAEALYHWARIGDTVVVLR